MASLTAQVIIDSMLMRYCRSPYSAYSEIALHGMAHTCLMGIPKVVGFSRPSLLMTVTGKMRSGSALGSA